MRTEGLLGEAVDRIGREPISARMARKAPVKHLDPALLLIAPLMAAFGSLMVFTATAADQREAGLDPATFLKRQIAYTIAGIVVLAAMSFFDYRYLRGFAVFIYGGTILLLLLVLTPLSQSVGGARRWINLGSFQAQPSEFAKLAVIVALAAYLAERKGEIRARDVAISCGIVLLPGTLIFLEPDLGTMMVFLALVAAVLLGAGAKGRHFLAMAGLGLLAMILALQAGLFKDYQIERLTAFLDPHPDLRSEGYNLTQAKTAVARGRLTGTGLDSEKSLTTLDFVPEQHTDFIFTAVGEQLGFVGAGALLSLFALLIWRALRIAAMSRDLFGTLLAAGVAALWAFQVFVNVGMTMGIMPITGIPLPFISYGGSSLVTNFAAVGLLHNVHMRRFL